MMILDILPILTVMIGLGGLVVGLFSFISPVSAARMYGFELPTSTSRSKPKKTDDDPTTRDQHNRIACIHSLGIRNLVVGLTILLLTWYWQFNTSSPAVQVGVQRCLGMVILVGSLTPVVDAVVAWRSSRPGMSSGLGKKASLLHAVRSLFWLAGGVGCLLGNG